VRLSAGRAGRVLPPGSFPVPVYAGGSVNPRGYIAVGRVR
jgi:hypothetical protein